MSTVRTEDRHLWVSAPGECDIQAGRTLYRLELGVLSKISAFFRNLSSQAIQQDGDVIVLSEFNEAEFEYFAYLAYKLPIKAGYKDMNKAVLLKAVELSKFLMSAALRDSALGHIKGRRYEFTLAEIFKLCRDLPTQEFVEYAFKRLLELQPKWTSLPPSDLTTIGLPVVVAAMKVQQGLEEHRHLLACDPPILTHSPTCADNEKCRQDWTQTWWNIIGRHLVEPLDEITWDEAVEQLFRSDFGVVDRLCLQSALEIVRDGDPVVAETHFINDATQKVIKLFEAAEDWEN